MISSNGKQLYARLLRFVLPYWRVFAIAVGAMAVLAATEPAMPALLKPTLDDGFLAKNLGIVSLMSFALVGIFAVRGLAAFTSAFAMAWVAGRVVMDLRVQMFDKLLSLPSSYYDAHPSARLISKITFDANQVTEAASHVLTVLVKDSLAIAGLLSWMLYLNWKLALVTLTAIPIVSFIVFRFSKRLRLMSRRLQENMGEVTQAVDETIGGQKEIRVYGAQAHEKNRFTRTANGVRRFQLKFASSAAVIAPIAQLVAATAAAIILYVAGHQAVVNEITIGGFASFFAAMTLMFAPLKRLTGINSRLQKGLAGAESVFALLDHEVEADTGTGVIKNARGKIEFDGVGFEYASSKNIVLEDVTFKIEPGEMVALVGSSGSGKSTVANLIPRFYEPSKGRIVLDGQPLNTLTLQSLREQIAFVSQDIVLFDDTLAANIAYGRDVATDEDAVIEAAKSANAWSFIEALNDGLQTMIGENGIRLSGGQRQRIAIARAFLKDAPILILDEATSSLDTVSERQVGTALETLRQGRTTLVIAHKLSTIEKADRIIVMDAGGIVGVGTHRELLRTNQTYAALYRFQFSGQDDDEPGGPAGISQH